MEGATAFQPFQSLQNLQQTACACPSPFNVPVQLTLGLTSLHQAGAGLNLSKFHCSEQRNCSTSNKSPTFYQQLSCIPIRISSITFRDGVAGKDGTDRPAQAPSLASQTLGDGRLNVGTHMPLLAKRYSYLSVIGEGASAQACSALHLHLTQSLSPALKPFNRLTQAPCQNICHLIK
jgi:hypothetical protein